MQDNSSECPQAVRSGAYGGWSLDPVGTNPPFWPLPRGGTVEIHVPVTSSASGVEQFKGIVALADGDTNPILQPPLVAIVDAASIPQSQQISVSYQNPSISNMSQQPNKSVTANFGGYVWNYSNPGSALAQVANSSSGTDCTSPKQPYYYTTSSVSLKNPDTSITGNFTGLYPGTAYCWRIVSQVGTSGHQTEYDGNWQFFVTPGAPLGGGTAPTTGVANCSAGGSGCQTAPCASGSNCAQCSSSCWPGLTPQSPTPTPTPTPSTPAPTPPAPPGGSTSTPTSPPPTAMTAAARRASTSSAGGHVLVDTGLSEICPPGGASCSVLLVATVNGGTAGAGRASKQPAATVVVGRVSYVVAAGHTIALRFTLSSRGVRLLNARHRLQLRLSVTADKGTGQATTLIKTITIARPPTAHPHRRR